MHRGRGLSRASAVPRRSLAAALRVRSGCFRFHRARARGGRTAAHRLGSTGDCSCTRSRCPPDRRALEMAALIGVAQAANTAGRVLGGRSPGRARWDRLAQRLTDPLLRRSVARLPWLAQIGVRYTRPKPTARDSCRDRAASGAAPRVNKEDQRVPLDHGGEGRGHQAVPDPRDGYRRGRCRWNPDSADH